MTSNDLSTTIKKVESTLESLVSTIRALDNRVSFIEKNYVDAQRESTALLATTLKEALHEVTELNRNSMEHVSNFSKLLTESLAQHNALAITATANVYSEQQRLLTEMQNTQNAQRQQVLAFNSQLLDLAHQMPYQQNIGLANYQNAQNAALLQRQLAQQAFAAQQAAAAQQSAPQHLPTPQHPGVQQSVARQPFGQHPQATQFPATVPSGLFASAQQQQQQQLPLKPVETKPVAPPAPVPPPQLPVAKPAPAAESSTVAAPQPTPFGDRFKKKEGEWDCGTCLITNTPNVNQCAACQTGKDGKPADVFAAKPTASVLPGATQNFEFGIKNNSPSSVTGSASANIGTPTQVASFNVKPAAPPSNSTGGSILFGKPVESKPAQKPVFGSGAVGSGASFEFGKPSTTTSGFKFGSATPATPASDVKTTTTTSTSTTVLGGNKVFGGGSANLSFGALAGTNTGSSFLNKSDDKAKTGAFGLPTGFQTKQPSTAAEGEEDDNPEGFVPSDEYAPVVPLPDVIEVKTGEEEEQAVFENRAKLFIFVNGENKERGLGPLRILYNAERKSYRVVMRREQTLKLCANFALKNVKVTDKPNTTTCGIVHCIDFSDPEKKGGEHCVLIVKFKEVSVYQNFRDTVNKINDGSYVFTPAENNTSSTIDEGTAKVMTSTQEKPKPFGNTSPQLVVPPVQRSLFGDITSSTTAVKPKPFTVAPQKPQTSLFGSLATGSSTGVAQKPSLFGGNAFGGASAFSAQPKPADSSDAAENPEEFVPNVEYAPVVDKLPPVVDVPTGEEDENTLYEERARLYVFQTEQKDYKEAGTGVVKILENPTTKVRRILMRREQVLKVCLNTRLTASFRYKLKENTDKVVIFSCFSLAPDVCDSHTVQTYALRMSSAERIKQFIGVIDETVALCKESSGNSSHSAAASVEPETPKNEDEQQNDDEEEEYIEDEDYEDAEEYAHDDDEDFTIVSVGKCGLTVASKYASPLSSQKPVVYENVTHSVLKSADNGDIFYQITFKGDGGDSILSHYVEKNQEFKLQGQTITYDAEDDKGSKRKLTVNFDTPADAARFHEEIQQYRDETTYNDEQ